MLFHTFLHIEGIGEKTELQLYKSGIYCWDDFLKAEKIDFINDRSLIMMKEGILESYRKYINKDINYFLHRMNKRHAWRLYKEFKKYCCFLDIETDGQYGMDSDITVIGVYSENGYKPYINGKNLKTFEDEILKYDLIITFNGSLFDFPVISRYFRTRYFHNIAHIDMRTICGSMDKSFRGGLKSIERKIGLYRPPEIRNLDGYDAVKLWHRYQNGERGCLDILIEYNKYDVLNLSKLSDFIYQYGVNLMKEKGLKTDEEGKDE